MLKRILLPKSYLLKDYVEKYIRVGQATNDDIMLRMRFTCRETKATDTLTICNTVVIAFPWQ
jgi:hypothetical protein